MAIHGIQRACLQSAKTFRARCVPHIAQGRVQDSVSPWVRVCLRKRGRKGCHMRNVGIAAHLPGRFIMGSITIIQGPSNAGARSCLCVRSFAPLPHRGRYVWGTQEEQHAAPSQVAGRLGSWCSLLRMVCLLSWLSRCTTQWQETLSMPAYWVRLLPGRSEGASWHAPQVRRHSKLHKPVQAAAAIGIRPGTA